MSEKKYYPRKDVIHTINFDKEFSEVLSAEMKRTGLKRNQYIKMCVNYFLENGGKK